MLASQAVACLLYRAAVTALHTSPACWGLSIVQLHMLERVFSVYLLRVIL